MAAFYLYLGSFFTNWFLYMTAGPFLVDEVLFRLFPHWRARISKRFPPKKRRQIEIAILIVGVFYAGFAAFKEEHDKLEAAQQKSPAPEFNVNERDPKARADLEKANGEITKLKEELGYARQDARSAREMAARVQPKPFNERLLECLDSIDPTIKEKLKTQTVIFRGELDIRKIEELQKLAKEPTASDYFELRIVSSGLTGMASGNDEISGTKGVEIVVERKLITPP